MHGNLPWWPVRGATPMVLQSEAGECGLACLAMVLAALGHRVDLGTLRARGGVSGRGLTLRTLMQLAAREKLSARPLRLEIEELGALRLPAILHWDLDHFVVLAGGRAGRWLVHDPAQGRRQLTDAELSCHFSGVALELVANADFQPREERRRLHLRELCAGVRGLWPALGQVLLLSGLLQGFALAMPFYTQLFLDDVLVHQDVPLMWVLATGFLLVTLARAITEYLRAEVVLFVSSGIGFQFASNLCQHLLHLPLPWFTQRHLGDVVSRFSSLTQVRDFLSSGMVEVVIDSLLVLTTLSLMLIYSVKLTLVAAVAVLLYVLVRMLSHWYLHRTSEEHIHAGAVENSLFMENVRAMQGIRLASREDDRLALWQNRHAATLNAGVRTQRVAIRMKCLHGFLTGTETVVLMLLGGLAVLRQDLSIGMLMAYIGFKDQCYARVFALIDKIFDYRMLALHLERLADIALSETEHHLDGCNTVIQMANNAGWLTLRDLAFRYDDQTPWLFENVSLELGEDEVVAIVGPSGCGKSTLLRIVTTLLQPTRGQLCLRGTPATRMGLRAWRGRVAGVMQDDVLFSGSLFDNITFFDPEPDREWVQEVAALAAIAGEIEALPMQYDTLVGSMGAALSGGQVQRILLARALYRRPRLLVLDEATSHLDLATERRVNQAIKALRIARLMVAHRPDSILLADRIVALTPQGLRCVPHAEIRARAAPAGHGPPDQAMIRSS